MNTTIDERPVQVFSIESFADALVARLPLEKRLQIASGLKDGAILSMFANVKPKLGIALLLLGKDGTTLEMGRFGPKAE
jgi:hypothetical protein